MHILLCVQIKQKESEIHISKSTSGNSMKKCKFQYYYVPVTCTFDYFRILVISNSYFHISMFSTCALPLQAFILPSNAWIFRLLTYFGYLYNPVIFTLRTEKKSMDEHCPETLLLQIDNFGNCLFWNLLMNDTIFAKSDSEVQDVRLYWRRNECLRSGLEATRSKDLKKCHSIKRESPA